MLSACIGIILGIIPPPVFTKQSEKEEIII
jgi:hypothetical protein